MSQNDDPRRTPPVPPGSAREQRADPIQLAGPEREWPGKTRFVRRIERATAVGPEGNALLVELEAVLASLADFATEDWARTTALAGWTVLDLACHLGDSPAAVVDGLAGARTGRVLPARAALGGREPGAVLDGLRGRIEELDGALTSLVPGELDRPWPRPGDGLTLPGRVGLRLALVEVGLHRHDLESAAGRSVSLSAPVVESAAELLPAWLVLAAAGAPLPLRPVGYRLAGQVVDVGLVFDGDHWAVGLPPEPDCVLTGDDEQLVLLLAGRRPVDGLPASDPVLAAGLKRFLPGP